MWRVMKHQKQEWWFFFFFFFWNLIHFKPGITVVPLFTCLLCLLSHRSKCLWEASHLSSKMKLTREMFKHIITSKHAILSGEKIEREREREREKERERERGKAVQCFEAFYGCCRLFRTITKEEMMSLCVCTHLCICVCVCVCVCVCTTCLVLIKLDRDLITPDSIRECNGAPKGQASKKQPYFYC